MDDSHVALNLDLVRAGHGAAPARPARQGRARGGQRYTLANLMEALLFSHYLRCAADFARAVVFAVSFAFGGEAGFHVMMFLVADHAVS